MNFFIYLYYFHAQLNQPFKKQKKKKKRRKHSTKVDFVVCIKIFSFPNSQAQSHCQIFPLWRRALIPGSHDCGRRHSSFRIRPGALSLPKLPKTCFWVFQESISTLICFFFYGCQGDEARPYHSDGPPSPSSFIHFFCWAACGGRLYFSTVG